MKIPEEVYWHAPFQLSDGAKILPTRVGNTERLGKRVALFQELVKTCNISFDGMSVLDIACAEGFFSHVALGWGASKVIGIDLDPIEIAKAEWVRSKSDNLRLEFVQGDPMTIDLPEVEITLCFGLLYHVENPLELISKLAANTKSTLIIDTDVLPLPGSFVKLEIEADRRWLGSEQQVVTMVPTLGAISTWAARAGFKSYSIAPVGSCAPIDYRSKRRAMIAFHKDAKGRLIETDCDIRPPDNGRNAAFSWRYPIGTLGYKLLAVVSKFVGPAVRGW